MQLIINLNFPFGRFHGREFPPSPSRLFQSLIAGSHRGIYEMQNAEIRDDALGWLETLSPPVIETSQFIESENITNYSPNNDDGVLKVYFDKSLKPKPLNRSQWLGVKDSGEFQIKCFTHNRSAQKSMQAFVLQDENAIRFIWTFSDNAENKRNAEVICKMARLATHLGHGQDLVFTRGEIVEEINFASEQSTVFRPKIRDGGSWTTPAKGALESYKKRYREFLQTGNSHTINASVRQVQYVSDDTLDLTCPYALFEIRESDDDEKFHSFDGRDLRQPAAMVRHAVSAIFDTPKGARFKKFYGEDVVSRKVFGHKTKSNETDKKCADEAHLAFIPLPNLYPDGKIRRILLVGFNFESEREHELFNDIAGNLNGAKIKDNGKPVGKLIRVKNQLKDEIFPLDKSAKTWRSVTPIILSGFTRRGRKPEHLVYRALNQIEIGNDAIESVAVFRSPIVPKTFRPMDYKIGKNDYLNESPRYHAEIIFKRPVRGVLVVGRGRHAGFGLMMPVD